MPQADFVRVRRKPMWFKASFLVLWITVIVSGLVFGLSLGYGLLTHTDTGWLAYRAGWVCFPAAIAMLLLMRKA